MIFQQVRSMSMWPLCMGEVTHQLMLFIMISLLRYARHVLPTILFHQLNVSNFILKNELVGIFIFSFSFTRAVFKCYCNVRVYSTYCCIYGDTACTCASNILFCDINLIISFPFMHFNPYRVDVTVNDNYFGK